MAVQIVPYVEGVSRPPKRDLTKEPQFGMWAVLSFAGRVHNMPYWNCRCGCGNGRAILQGNLVSGKSMSCGCAVVEATRNRNTTHGKSRTAEYNIWCGTNARCYNYRTANFHRYGGRGITVCQRWRDSFPAFLEDMGPRPSLRHSLDRYPDKDGNYGPENCRWATDKEQANNTRANRKEVYNGETKNLIEWAEYAGIGEATLRKRLSLGWPIEKAIETPLRTRKQ